MSNRKNENLTGNIKSFIKDKGYKMPKVKKRNSVGSTKSKANSGK